jgi:hypothetical protein
MYDRGHNQVFRRRHHWATVIMELSNLVRDAYTTPVTATGCARVSSIAKTHAVSRRCVYLVVSTRVQKKAAHQNGLAHPNTTLFV